MKATRIRRFGGPVLLVLSALAFVMAAVSPAAAAPSITVTPHDNLTDKQTVMVSGSGFSPPQGLPFAIVLECNNDPSMPTVGVQGQQVPVGCTNPLNALFNFDKTGSLPPTAFVVHKGTVGPPGTGTDSAGHDAAADAALFPCPPTQAQIDKGVGCDIILADISQVRATQPITFAGSGTTTTTTGATTTTTKPSTTTTTTGGTTTTTTGGTTTTTSGATTTTTKPSTTTTTTHATTTTTQATTSTSESTTTTVVGPTTSTTVGGPSVVPGAGVASPGGQLSLTGTGFPPNTALSIIFASTPQTIATITSDANGAFSTTVTIPANAETGTHTITVQALGGTVSKAITIQVAPAAVTTTIAAAAAAAATTSTLPASVLGTTATNSTVAFTGANSERWAAIGGFCLLAGLILVFNARPLKPLKQSNR